MTNKYANRDALLGACGKRRYADVLLPISGLTVRIQSLTEREMSEYQAAVIASNSGGRIQYLRQRLLDASRRLMALCLVDGDGNRLFADDEYDQLSTLDAKDASALYDACAQHCGISREDVETLAKNSEVTHVVDSPTD